ncbi:hypothetical protein ACQKIY_25205 [Bacillus mycoides]|uniref:hypothetical protein n=1 Tax=Bacillus mycoides TaxID=1405 RepID=UPI003CFBCB74
MVYLLEFHFPYTKETVPKALIESEELLSYLVQSLHMELKRNRLDKYISVVTSNSECRDDVSIISREFDVFMFIYQFKKQYCLHMA